MTDNSVNYSDVLEVAALKVPGSGGKSYSDIIRDTDKVIEKNRMRFVRYLADDIKEVQKMFRVYMQYSTPENLRPIFDRIHNLRGQGTLFDYPLVTTIGGHFCRYIDNLPDDVSPRREVVQTFINSLQVVQAEQIKGEGSENLQVLTETMGRMVDALIEQE